MRFSRRHFGRMAAAVLPASLLGQGGGRRPIPKPNSRFAGVQIGVISYSFNTVPAMDLIPTIAKLGINEVELMSNHAETLVGAPTAPPRGPGGGGGARGGGPPQAPAIAYYSGDACAGRQNPQPAAASAGRIPAPLAPEQEKFHQDQAQWRTSDATMNKYRDLRKQF